MNGGLCASTIKNIFAVYEKDATEIYITEKMQIVAYYRFLGSIPKGRINT